jgi:hypothetical protein
VVGTPIILSLRTFGVQRNRASRPEDSGYEAACSGAKWKSRLTSIETGVQMQIDTNYPVQIRKTSKEALSGILGNVETEKVALNALLDHTIASRTIIQPHRFA